MQCQRFKISIADHLSVCHRDLLANMGVWAHILVPVLQDSSYSCLDCQLPSSATTTDPALPKLWGFLAVQECSGPRIWHKDEIEFLQKLSVQIAIAIQQAQRYRNTQNALKEKRTAERQLQVLNAALEQRVRERTAQFERANLALQEEVIVPERGDRQWQSRIYKALEEGRFHLHIQPINPVSKLKGRQLAEVLLRLTGEDRQLIMPAAFIPAAERYQLMPTLDRWVIQSFLDS